jgi:hypothetical protein
MAFTRTEYSPYFKLSYNKYITGIKGGVEYFIFEQFSLQADMSFNYYKIKYKYNDFDGIVNYNIKETGFLVGVDIGFKFYLK